MKEVLLIRYSLAPFLYTLHYQTVTTSATVLQPLHYEFRLFIVSFLWLHCYFGFPNDNRTLGIDPVCWQRATPLSQTIMCSTQHRKQTILKLLALRKLSHRDWKVGLVDSNHYEEKSDLIIKSKIFTSMIIQIIRWTRRN